MQLVEEALRKLPLADVSTLVGCSGGVDSMTLLAAALRCGLQPEVLHVNYQLRGADSDADEALVAHFCKENGLNFIVRKMDPVALKMSGINLQNAARNYRREQFDCWLEQHPDGKVLLAHHADDQVETFFLQLFRGAGISGLGAMHLQRGAYFRPFLHITKDELQTYAEKHNIPFRTDASNTENVYLRNLLRNEILPKLKSDFPTLADSIQTLTACFRDEYAAIEFHLADDLEKWKNKGKIPVVRWNTLSDDHKSVFLNKIGVGARHFAGFNHLTTLDTGKSYRAGERVFEISQRSISERRLLPNRNLETASATANHHNLEECVTIDRTKVWGAVILRNWTKGDVLTRKGRPAISVEKFLKAHHLSAFDRLQIQVVADDQQVIWIPGLYLNDAYRSENDENLIRLKVSELRL